MIKKERIDKLFRIKVYYNYWSSSHIQNPYLKKKKEKKRNALKMFRI